MNVARTNMPQINYLLCNFLLKTTLKKRLGCSPFQENVEETFLILNISRNIFMLHSLTKWLRLNCQENWWLQAATLEI
jgi:hypothetical protein